MRDLTQEEIDEAPEWALNFRVIENNFTPKIISYNCGSNKKKSQAYYLDHKTWTPICFGATQHEEFKPIPREKFDINKYYEDRNNYDDPYICTKIDGDDCCIVDGSLGKEDAIAIAKYFKLTPEDLK